MIPAFTSNGLLPAGVHVCNLADIPAIFCGNLHRTDLFTNLQLCLADMKAAQLSGKVVINGSFVTDKEIPNDVELTLDARATSDQDKFRAFMYFQQKHGYAKAAWKVDWYPTLDAGNNFVTFFQYVGVKSAVIKNIPANSPKGVLGLRSW